MSIQTELNRIKEASNAIKTAIQNIGGKVTYNPGLTPNINDYATALAALSQYNVIIQYKDIINNSDATVADLNHISPLIASDMSYLFANLNKLQSIDISTLNTSQVTNMRSLFSDCSELQTLDLSNFDVSNVTDISYMFNNCKKLTSINLSNWNTQNVKYLNYLFATCLKLVRIDVNHFNTSKVEGNITGAFYQCRSAEEIHIEDWDVSNCTNAYRLFHECWKLKTMDFSKWNTSNFTNCRNLFTNCWEINNINLSNCDFSKVVDFGWAFYSCKALTTIITDGLKLPNIDMSDIYLHQSPLSVDTIVGLLNALPNTTDNYSFNIGTTNINKLTDEQKFIAVNKGWTLI